MNIRNYLEISQIEIVISKIVFIDIIKSYKDIINWNFCLQYSMVTYSLRRVCGGRTATLIANQPQIQQSLNNVHNSGSIMLMCE